MTKTLADLQTLCSNLGLVIAPQQRPAKDPYILALRDHFWAKDNPGKPLPEQIAPMLLADADGGVIVRRGGGSAWRRSHCEAHNRTRPRSWTMGAPIARSREVPRCTPIWSYGPRSAAAC
jgi:hypothetical protein